MADECKFHRKYPNIKGKLIRLKAVEILTINTIHSNKKFIIGYERQRRSHLFVHHTYLFLEIIIFN
jgi:hypothetical protein